jgi:hypothetical protein
MKKIMWLSMVMAFVVGVIACTPSQESVQQEDKATKIARFLEDFINRPQNSGGKVTCNARRIGDSLIQCDLYFVSEMDNLSIIANTKGIAEMNGESGLAATIYFAGYREQLKVCEYKWDMHNRTVTRVK